MNRKQSLAAGMIEGNGFFFDAGTLPHHERDRCPEPEKGESVATTAGFDDTGKSRGDCPGRKASAGHHRQGTALTGTAAARGYNGGGGNRGGFAKTECRRPSTVTVIRE